MNINSEKPETAEKIIEEAISNVEEYTGETPNPHFIDFDAYYTKKHKADGRVDPVGRGIYLTHGILGTIEGKDVLSSHSGSGRVLEARNYSVPEHELAHFVHLNSMFDEELDQEYISALEAQIPELQDALSGENWSLEATLCGYAFQEYTGRVNAGNFEILAALKHEEVDNQELKETVEKLEGMAEEEKRRHRKRHRSDEIDLGERNHLWRKTEGMFADSVREEASKLLEGIETPEPLKQMRGRVETLKSCEWEKEAETNARLVEFMVNYNLNEENPYRDELESGDLSDIGSRIESAQEFYRFGDQIAEHLFESIETFYRLKEVYRQAGVKEPGEKAAKNLVQAGIGRIKAQ